MILELADAVSTLNEINWLFTFTHICVNRRKRSAVVVDKVGTS